MAKTFENKVVIVTGAGGDIGRLACQRFVEQGAKLVVVDLIEHGVLDTVQHVKSAGGEAVGVTGDVSLAATAEAYVAAANEAYGGVDILINNAGIEGSVAPVEAYDDSAFDKVMAVNVRGVYLGMKHAAPALKSRGGGAIVNLASVAGLTAAPAMVAYNASKHAVIGMTRSVGVELGPDNIRVNAVCPSPVQGRMMRSLEAGLSPDDPEALQAQVAEAIPMKRYAEPEDVVSLILYLASDAAAFLNAGVYTVDGGLTAV